MSIDIFPNIHDNPTWKYSSNEIELPGIGKCLKKDIYAYGLASVTLYKKYPTVNVNIYEKRINEINYKLIIGAQRNTVSKDVI